MGIKVINQQAELTRFLGEIDADILEIHGFMLQVLQVRTPAVTGFHRGNWIPEKGGVSPRVRGSRKAPPSRLPPLRTFDIRRDRSIFIHNSGPAILRLDGGLPFTAKAPQGITEPAFADVRARYAGVVR